MVIDPNRALSSSCTTEQVHHDNLVVSAKLIAAAAAREKEEQDDNNDTTATLTTKLGLPVLALQALSNDRRLRATQIYQRVQQLQQHHSLSHNAAQRISMASRSLSRPSRLFARYTAAVCAVAVTTSTMED